MDPRNCGGCGTSCPVVANAASGCEAGGCKITSCSKTFADCNGLASDGCETPIADDTAHCGACNHTCDVPGTAGALCHNGVCIVGWCAADKVDCDGVLANGCEADVSECDPSPPAPISIKAESGEQVKLTWQAVGDSGNVGQADHYIIRYAKTPITDDAAFAAATAFTQPMKPQPAGAQEVIEVVGLQPRATYYFVVRAVDTWGRVGLFGAGASAKAGSFGLAVRFVDPDCCAVIGAAWGDYDGDGDLDAVVGAGVYRNDGGNFTLVQQLGGSSPVWLDYDRDGALDLVIGGTIHRNLGGTFVPITKIDAGYHDRSWADADNDGDLDILSRGKTVLRNDGQARFVASWAADVDNPWDAATWLDADGDGDADLLVIDKNGSADVLRLYGNDGSGVMTPQGAVAAKVDPLVMGRADIDGDGDMDVVATADLGGDPPTQVLTNDGTGKFHVVWSAPSGSKGWPDSIAWGDFDNDGAPDLVLGSVGDTQATVYRNLGKGQLAHSWDSAGGGGYGEPVWGDFDGDGDLDLLVGGVKESSQGTIIYDQAPAVYKSYEADFFGKNAAPTQPTGLSASFDASQSAAIFRFSTATDPDPDGSGTLGATPALGLSYQIAVGTGPASVDVVSPLVGTRLIAPYGQLWLAPGKHGLLLHNPPAGMLFWRVRAVDAGLLPGAWSAQKTLFVSKSTAHGWPTAQTNNDTTGEHIHELQLVDAADALPTALTNGDGWYTVPASVTLSVGGFNMRWSAASLIGLTLTVRYSTDANYEPKNPLRWGFAGGALKDTGLIPKAGQTHAVATFDLFAAGVKTSAQVQSLVVSFTNGSGSGPERELAFDQFILQATVAP